MNRASLALFTSCLCAAPAAWADSSPTLAVLPLEKGAASETYDGLGTALAGMLVTDLSSVPGITLVERQRLDALMEEMKLGKSGFVDAQTAQKLGKGLGAQYVVMGSYSVVAKTFLLDARVVRVESGRILQAAKSQGTIDDFVSVEKELVEGLLEGLSVKLTSAARRQLYVQAPTEKFSAFSAYGEGLARQQQGRVAEARAAFERALSLDPRFEAARSSLSSMRATVDEAKAQQRATQAKFRDDAHRKILDAYPSELTRKKGFVDDTASLAGFALRLMVLENEDRHCDRHKEMRHYLDRVGWQVRLPPRARGEAALSSLVNKEADVHGFRGLSSAVATSAAAKKSPRSRLDPFDSTYAFIIGDDRVHPHSETSGLLSAIQGCYEPKEQLRRIEALKAEAKARDVAHLTGGRRANFDLQTSLDLMWAWIHGKELGATPALSKRTKDLLSGVEDDARAKADMIRYVEHVLRMADTFERHQLRRLGKSQAELTRVMTGLEAQDPKVVTTQGPYCAHLVKTLAPQAKGWGRRWRKAKSQFDVDFSLDQAGPMYGALRDMGCLVGQRARFSDARELHHLLSTIERYATPGKKNDDTCISAFQSAESIATPMMLQQIDQSPAVGPALAHGYLMTLYAGLVGQGCVSIEGRK